MSAIRIAVTVVGAAITMTRNAAYNAGVVARHLVGRRAP